MNERIKQLAEQAGIEFTYDPTETPMRAFVECWEDEMAKFAELIIRECAGLFPNVYVEIETEYGHTPVVASDYIKKHFGVEL